MKTNQLILDVCDYVLSDDKEMEDFLLNYSFTKEEMDLIRSEDGNLNLSSKIIEIFSKHPECKNHIYYKTKMLMNEFC